VALIPVWWVAFLFVVLMMEEQSMERALGQPYLEDKQWVKVCILPGLSI
jgi:protein-S-isoprenylcysteine O-methyltransferase Ste14